MIKYIKTIKDTYIYSQMNKDGYIDKKLQLFSNPNSSIPVTPEMLEEQVLHINKTFKYPAKMAVLEAFKNGALVPVMLKPGISDKMPVSIPFLFNKDRSKAMVFIDSHARFRNKETMDIDIDYKKFYCLMESAYLAMEGFRRSSASIITKGSSIYAHMFTRVLNKKFALNTNRLAMNKVLFLASKFFMINHLGMKDQNMVFNYALKNCNSATAIAMRDVEGAIGEEAFVNISTFLTALANSSYRLVSGFSSITTRDYINSFANMYGQSTIFALESLDYFMFVISSVAIGAYLNNQVILEDIVDKDGMKLYLEIGR